MSAGKPRTTAEHVDLVRYLTSTMFRDVDSTHPVELHFYQARATPVQTIVVPLQFGAEPQMANTQEGSDPTTGTPARGKRPAPRGTAAYPRKRAVSACQVCRARRTKCDNAKPACSFCRKVGAVCIQSAVDLSSFDPASLRILERLDDIESILQRNELGNKQLAYTIPAAPEYPESLQDVQLLPGNLEQYLEWHFLQPFRVLPQTHLLAVLRQHQTGSPSHAFTPSPTSTNADLEPRTTRILVDNFFQYCHVKNPILSNEREVRQMISYVSLHGIDWSPQSCLTLLICALGAISTPFGESTATLPGTAAYATSQSYFQAAQKRLGSLVATSGVVEAQCLFLAGVYSMCLFKPTHAWRYFSQALACCQEFDFITHTAPIWGDTETFEMQHDPEALSIAEQAIYWSSWKSERELRSALQPQDYPLPDKERALYPAFFPTPPPPSDTSPEEAENVHATRETDGWYFYLSEISLRRLASRQSADILDLRPSTNLIDALVTSLPGRETQVEQWVSSLPTTLSLQAPPDQDDVTRFVIRGHLINLYEMLYWPFLDAYISNLDLAQSRSSVAILQANIPIADDRLKQLAEKSLQIHVERMHVNRPGFKHRHHGTWFMIRSCTASALVLMKAASYIHQCPLPNDHVSRLVLPLGWKEAVVDAIDLNQYWEAEVPDAANRLPLLQQAWQAVEGLQE